LSRNNKPVWDSEKYSTIKKPLALLEGSKWTFVDQEDVMYRADGGRGIFVEEMAPVSLKSNPNGTLITMKAAKRKSAPPQMFGGGQSARLTPTSPTAGHICDSSYARLLDGFASGSSHARRLFKARKTVRNKGGVSRELQMQTAERSILFYPFAGMTEKVRERYRRKPIIAPKQEPEQLSEQRPDADASPVPGNS
jgi:hypothetical protein